MASIARHSNGKWRARYYDDEGVQHAKHFGRKVQAQQWLDRQTAALVAGTHVTPRTARTTVSDWSGTWIEGYRGHRASTVRQAEVHLARIVAEFGPMPLASVRPSHVKAWTAKLTDEGLAPSYVYALHARLAQLYTDAVQDGIVARSPVSRRTSPRAGAQRAYVASTADVWGLHDAMPEHLRAAVLLGAFVGLRVSEVCGLRVSDVDFIRGVVSPAVQWPADPLKSETSRADVPIPQPLALELSAHVAQWSAPDGPMLANLWGQQLTPWTLERAIRVARVQVVGLPDGFRFHDLRHYFASMLIAAGSDVKIVQARLRHASAKTTLDTYGHLWPDSDESTRMAVEAAMSRAL